MHWLPFAILGLFAAVLFVPNMCKKDQSLSRYPEFADYKARSVLLPELLGSADGSQAASTQPPTN